VELYARFDRLGGRRGPEADLQGWSFDDAQVEGEMTGGERRAGIVGAARAPRSAEGEPEGHDPRDAAGDSAGHAGRVADGRAGNPSGSSWGPGACSVGRRIDARVAALRVFDGSAAGRREVSG
jgi:hypothetical protein